VGGGREKMIGVGGVREWGKECCLNEGAIL